MAYYSYFNAMMEISRMVMAALLLAEYSMDIGAIKALLIAKAIAHIKVQ